MNRIRPCLWYDGAAEEAANFYVSLLAHSRIDHVLRAPADNPSTPEGAVLVVDFTLAGRPFMALNGGPLFKFTEAISILVETEDQEETDRLWEALTANGGTPAPCGWLKDRWGMSWQITPRRLLELMASPDPDVARRTMQAMMTMGKIDIAAIEAAARGDAGHA